MCYSEVIKILNKFVENVSLNQNLIILIVCYMGVAYADMHNLCCLCHISWLLFIASVVSVLFSLVFYTIEYCNKKWNKVKSPNKA